MRNDNLGIPLLVSLAAHVSIILLGAAVFHNDHWRPRDFLPFNLVELPRAEIPPPQKKFDASREIKKPAPPPPEAEKPAKKPPVAKPARAEAEPAAPLPPAPVQEEPPRAAEAKPTPAQAKSAPSFDSSARVEGGGSAAGAGNLFGKGDVGVVPGAGTAGGGGGTAVSGLGRSSGIPGLPAPPVLRTSREAKPIQIVRAAYPPMALRAGLESDVTLKIEVDAQGNVTKALVAKSGGAGFDEEAVKAVKQSRFEPAERDGRYVAAEFTYVYRFRLRK